MDNPYRVKDEKDKDWIELVPQGETAAESGQNSQIAVQGSGNLSFSRIENEGEYPKGDTDLGRGRIQFT